VEPSRERVFERLKDPSFDPRRTAILTEAPATGIAPAAAGEPEKATFDVYEPGRVEFRVHAATNALLVLSEINFPGWETRLNGQLVRTHRTDWMIQSFSVPAGDSEIKMRYEPGPFAPGAILTVLAFVGTLAFAFLTLR